MNQRTREAIVDSLGDIEGRLVWEIGPGLGNMTHHLLDRGARVLAFEVDKGFARLLEREFSAFSPGQFSLVTGDVLKTWGSFREPAPDKVMGNLPYNVGAVIIATLLEQGFVPGTMVFLLQREVARRLAAGPGDPEYAALSVLCGAWCKVELLDEVGPANFYPAPEVVSTLVRLVPRSPQATPGAPVAFARFARALFASRRKTLRNNLEPLLRGRLHQDAAGPRAPDLMLQACAEAGIDPACRAETLSPALVQGLFVAVEKALGPA